MKAQLFVFLVVAIIGSRARCPGKGFMESLDLKKFMGTWYQHASFGSLFVKGINSCVKSTYELDQDGKTIRMVNDFIVKGIKNHVKSNWTATASEASEPTGKLSLEIKLPGNYGLLPVVGKMKLGLLVLDTDYDNYAILYLCQNIVVNNLEFGFIFTRKRTYSEEDLKPILEKADVALAKVGVKRSRFTVTEHKNCDKSSFTIDVATVAKVVNMAGKTAMTVAVLAG